MATETKTKSVSRETQSQTRPFRSFQRDDPAEKARQAKGEFASASDRAKGKQQQAPVPDPLDRKEPPTQARIDEWMGELSPGHSAKVKQLIQMNVIAQGYQGGTREGSGLWEKAKTVVVSGLIMAEADLDEIDLSGES